MVARAAAQAVAMRRSPARTVLETSPKKLSGSLGVVERANQALGGEVRTLRLDAQARFGVPIYARSPAF
eukprot:5057338-Heterocapsa_arctica.AAC.1